MRSPLDEMMEALRKTPTDADLSQIGPRTWLRIEELRRRRTVDAWLLPAQAAALVLALTAGTALGAAYAREAPARTEVAAFEVASALAPSTLLDRR